MQMMDRFDSLSPLDFRYHFDELVPYLSENAFTRYKLRAELVLVQVLHARGLCPSAVVAEVMAAIEDVTTEEVYAEEARIKHDIRALVNCIRKRVSDRAKPFVHMTATSYDIVDTANAARYADAWFQVIGPALVKLEKSLIALALREAETVQIGRTHGQHAVPITFGYAVAGYVARLGASIERLNGLARALPGKFSGAVGAYNASSLFFDDPEAFEAEVLAAMGLEPAEHATQIVPPEAMARFVSETTMACGIMADLADDLRHLQRTEIGEVGEAFEGAQVGSSTMPQKRNPINFENAKSMWKIVASRVILPFLDQLSEHQRDLTNSASGRGYGEVFAYAFGIAERLERTVGKLRVDERNLRRNLLSQLGLAAAEPLYIMLAAFGHPDAHQKVLDLTRKAERQGLTLDEVASDDVETRPYLRKMSAQQREIITNPSCYTGIAARKARAIAERWKARFGL